MPTQTRILEDGISEDDAEASEVFGDCESLKTCSSRSVTGSAVNKNNKLAYIRADMYVISTRTRTRHISNVKALISIDQNLSLLFKMYRNGKTNYLFPAFGAS